MLTRTLSALLLFAFALTLAPAITTAEEPQAAVPDALKGFRGMMVGELVEKGENEFTFKIQKITKTWKKNEAEHPEQAVGQTVTISLSNTIKHHEEKIRANYAAMTAGDKIEVEAFDEGGEKLFVKEALKKVEKD